MINTFEIEGAVQYENVFEVDYFSIIIVYTADGMILRQFLF